MTREEINAFRYNVKRPHRPVLKDAFLSAMMDLFFARNQLISGASRRRIEKLLQPVAELLHLEDAADPENRALFTDAYREVALFYIQIGKTDRSYSTGIMNLVPLSDEQFRRKVKADFLQIGTEVPERADMSELFAPFREGLAMAYNEYFNISDEAEQLK